MTTMLFPDLISKVLKSESLKGIGGGALRRSNIIISGQG